jgi:hypothetical protein
MPVRIGQPAYSWYIVKLGLEPCEASLLIEDQILIRGICFVGWRPTSINELPAALFQQLPKFVSLLLGLALPPHAEKFDFGIRELKVWAQLHFLSDRVKDVGDGFMRSRILLIESTCPPHIHIGIWYQVHKELFMLVFTIPQCFISCCGLLFIFLNRLVMINILNLHSAYTKQYGQSEELNYLFHYYTIL